MSKFTDQVRRGRKTMQSARYPGSLSDDVEARLRLSIGHPAGASRAVHYLRLAGVAAAIALVCGASIAVYMRSESNGGQRPVLAGKTDANGSDQSSAIVRATKPVEERNEAKAALLGGGSELAEGELPFTVVAPAAVVSLSGLEPETGVSASVSFPSGAAVLSMVSFEQYASEASNDEQTGAAASEED